MVKQTIQIFARVKPTKSKIGLYEIDNLEDDSPVLSFFIPKDIAGGLVNNKKEKYKFKFEKVFDQKSGQDEIFENVAQPVIDNVINGYNGTIFAYGQTGSGKTFTITGGPEKFSQRGIIPRTLHYIYEQYQKMGDREFTTHVSYLEIYNENGYDLLDPKHDAAKLEDLPKVTLMEDEGQNIHLKNLSVHPSSNEEEALNLLFLGDTNRMIAETPMNQASTRSHCIFTVHLMSKEVGSATVRRSKLHLVDLAGSERVSKTGVNGVLLQEAKYINLSLHYLEQVIVSLSEKSRQHIPYRNSMMTSVLRDSLGGNCMTTMIATCSVEKKNIDESISTCRFAQRVAMIKNDALLNEELDPRLMVEKLKKDIILLKEELALATGEQRTDALTDEQILRCTQAVDSYLNDSDKDAILDIGADMRQIQMCYSIMKTRLLCRPEQEEKKTPRPVEPDHEMNHYDKMELKKMQDTLTQRDNEINILVNMLKKEKKRWSERSGRHSARHNGVHPPAESQGHQKMSDMGRQSTASSVASSSEVVTPNHHNQHKKHHREHRPTDTPNSMNSREENQRPISARHRAKTHVSTKQILGDMSTGRQQAFELFKRDYKDNRTIESNKHSLKQKYLEAKSLGERVNSARAEINNIKSQLEQYRMKKAIQGHMTESHDVQEQEMRDAIDRAKNSYKENFARLRTLKSEIEHLQHFLERSKVQLMKDFEFWWAEQTSHIEAQQAALQQDVKSAWRTPPPSGGQAAYPSSNHTRVPRSSDFSSVGNSSSRLQSSYSGQQQNAGDRISDTSSSLAEDTSIQLTGDEEADADIMAFMKARQNVMQIAKQRPPR